MTAAGAVLDLSGQISPRFPPAGSNYGIIPFDVNVELDVLDCDHTGDAILIFQFPSVAFLFNGTGGMVAKYDDMDTHGTPTVAFNVGVGAVDGVLDYILITGSTGAETGIAETQATLTSANPWLDVGDLYLILDVTAVGTTPADGGVRIGGWYTQQLILGESVESTNL